MRNELTKNRAVWKYKLELQDYSEIEMPLGAKILCAKIQDRDILNLWCLVTPGEACINRKFRIAGTGHPIIESDQFLDYIDTVFIKHLGLVFHIFEAMG